MAALHDLTALEQGDLVRRGEVSPVELVEHYLDRAARQRFAELMAGLVADGRCHWVSNEAPEVLRGVADTGPKPPHGRFVLGLDGRAVGHTHAHGRALHWWRP